MQPTRGTSLPLLYLVRFLQCYGKVSKINSFVTYIKVVVFDFFKEALVVVLLVAYFFFLQIYEELMKRYDNSLIFKINETLDPFNKAINILNKLFLIEILIFLKK